VYYLNIIKDFQNFTNLRKYKHLNQLKIDHDGRNFIVTNSLVLGTL